VLVEEQKKHPEQEYVVSETKFRELTPVLTSRGASLSVTKGIQGLYSECIGICE